MTMKLGVQEKPAFYNVLRTVRLGDVAQSMKNGIYKSKDAYSHDGIACLRMYNIGDGRIIWRDIKRMVLSEQERDEYGLEPGDLLVNRVNSRELVGKTALVPAGIERSVFESKNIRVRLDRHLVEPAYVNYALLALGRAHFNQNAQQVVGMASVSQPQVAAFQFLLRPVTQQREVVAYLDEQLSRLDASVAALHRVQANLKRYTKSLIQSLTSASASSTWPEVSVDDIAQSLDNMREPVNKTERALRGGNVPYLGANGQTGWIDKPLFDEELVLVVEDETFVGRTQPFCYYFAGECWVNNHTHVLRAKPGIVTAKYLNFALSYYPFIPLTTGSTGRRKLTKKALMAAPLSLPPLAEQHRIVAEADRRLSLIRVAESQVATNLARAQRLRQSMLQAAFAAPAPR
jgi:Type I restriction modification DNA specificity domain